MSGRYDFDAEELADTMPDEDEPDRYNNDDAPADPNGGDGADD